MTGRNVELKNKNKTIINIIHNTTEVTTVAVKVKVK